MRDYCIKQGYRPNLKPKYDGGVVDYGVFWQSEVYDLAFERAVKQNARYIIDIGSGNGEKLKKFEGRFKIIAVDIGKETPCFEKEVIEASVIIFAGGLERVIEPHITLEWLSKLSRDCAALLLSTPDRDRIRGKGGMGPPGNPAHVREWNYEEFSKLLSGYNFRDVRMDYTTNNNIDRNKNTLLAVCGKRCAEEESPLVSIIIPLYNKEKYFERCFNSAAKQSYTNIECLIIDDKSTDGSLALCRSLVKNYRGEIKFSIIRHEENRGLSGARNTGVKNASGEYVFFLDADDEITENCVLSLVKEAGKHIKTDIVQGNEYRIPLGAEAGDYIDNKKRGFPEFIGGNKEIKKHRCIPPTIPEMAWNKLIRRGFILDNNLWFKDRLIHEDNHWRFFALKKIESIAFTNDCCYIYHFVPDSIMTNQDLFPSIQSSLVIIEDMINNLDLDLLKEELLYIRNWLALIKERILSDARYHGLLNKCLSLESLVEAYFLKLHKKSIIAKAKQKLKNGVKKIPFAASANNTRRRKIGGGGE
jgi:glycosyltransferase involved in cell wall biosynthesis